mgnify:FL=1|jgi:hypothetical protein
MEEDLSRSEVGIYPNSLKTLYPNYIMSKCPNFPVCGKMYDPTLKVCGRCFWRFKNEILEFKNDECPICFKNTECVKFRKCEHFICLNCLNLRRECPKCIKTPK